jgi:hypothetical protein
VLKEVGLLGLDMVGGKRKTWLLELPPGRVEEEEEEGTGSDDKDAASKEIVVDAENVVAKTELTSVKIAESLG